MMKSTNKELAELNALIAKILIQVKEHPIKKSISCNSSYNKK